MLTKLVCSAALLLGVSSVQAKPVKQDYQIDGADPGVRLFVRQKMEEGNTRFADEVVPYLKSKGVGAMNAGPFSARLLTNAPLPAWLKEPEEVKAAARRAAAHCASKGIDISKLALQFSLANPDIATTVSGSANPQNIRNWTKWAQEPIDHQLLAEVQGAGE